MKLSLVRFPSLGLGFLTCKTGVATPPLEVSLISSPNWTRSGYLGTPSQDIWSELALVMPYDLGTSTIIMISFRHVEIIMDSTIIVGNRWYLL